MQFFHSRRPVNCMGISPLLHLFIFFLFWKMTSLVRSTVWETTNTMANRKGFCKLLDGGAGRALGKQIYFQGKWQITVPSTMKEHNVISLPQVAGQSPQGTVGAISGTSWWALLSSGWVEYIFTKFWNRTFPASSFGYSSDPVSSSFAEDEALSKVLC